MKYFIKIILLFVLITPKCSIAQYSDACSDLTRKQIIDSIKVHPNLKYELNFKCFKKLTVDDLYRFYVESQSIISNYENNRSITNFGTILMSIAATDLVAIPFAAKALQNTDGTIFFVMADLFIPIAIVGIIVHYVGPHKRDLYNSLRKYHREHPVK